MPVWKTEASKPKGTVVIVHGAGEHYKRYQWLKDQFLSHQFHVVAGDLPGHGRTETPGHIDSFNEYIKTIEKWVEQALEFQLPVYLIGHSMGGLAVIRTLQETRLPIKKVCLSSPCLGIKIPPPKPLKWVAQLIGKVKPDFLIRTKRSGANSRATKNPEILQRDQQDDLILQKVSVNWYWELERAVDEAHQHAKEFPNLPLLVMQAGDDLVVDKEAVYAFYQQLAQVEEKEYTEWDGLYHEIFNERERTWVFQKALQFFTR